MRRHTEIERLQFLDNVRRFVNRVDAFLRHGSMSSDTTGFEHEAHTSFVRYPRSVCRRLTGYQRSPCPAAPAETGQVGRALAGRLFPSRKNQLEPGSPLANFRQTEPH